MISILLSTYNRATYLPTALDSVLAQTYSDWELLISNDGSTDHTQSIVAPYLHDARVRYLPHTNIQVAHSRNLAARLALGDYFAILDSDDYYAADHLGKNIQFLTQHDLDFCHSHPVIEGGPPDFYVADKNDLTQMVHINDCAVGGTFVFKRAVFEALGGFKDLGYSEDGDFLERAQLAGFKIGLCPTPTYHYNVGTPGSRHKVVIARPV